MMEKKTYIKPEIMFEDFTMSTNIAVDCDVRNSLPRAGECAYIVAGIKKDKYIFTSDVGDCTTKEVDEDGVDDRSYDGICYDNPSETMSLFNSL